MSQWWRRLSTWALMYLPVFLMLALALGSFWFLKQTPESKPLKTTSPAREIPEVIIQGASFRTFDASGALQSELTAKRMLRYQASGIAEIEGLQMHSRLQSGGQAKASANRARANADMTEVQLIGDAQMEHTSPVAAPAQLRGDFLHFFVDQERVESHLPIVFTQGKDSLTAAKLRYDQVRGILDASGGVTLVLDPAD